MRDWAGGAPLAGGLGALSSVQDLNIGLALEVGVTAALGGLGGLVRRLLFGNYGHCFVHVSAVATATTAVAMSFELPVGYLTW